MRLGSADPKLLGSDSRQQERRLKMLNFFIRQSCGLMIFHTIGKLVPLVFSL